MSFKALFSLLMMIVCTTSGCVSDNDPQGPSLQVGDSLPQFTVEMNTGTIISTSSLLGKTSVIVFFNTDCGDCRKELPVIQQLWEKYKETPDVEIIPIAREESASQIEEYWKENNLTMPYSPQDNREVYSLFAPSVIPRIFIADKEGKITATFDDQNMPGLETLVEKIK